MYLTKFTKPKLMKPLWLLNPKPTSWWGGRTSTHSPRASATFFGDLLYVYSQNWEGSGREGRGSVHLHKPGLSTHTRREELASERQDSDFDCFHSPLKDIKLSVGAIRCWNSCPFSRGPGAGSYADAHTVPYDWCIGPDFGREIRNLFKWRSIVS